MKPGDFIEWSWNGTLLARDEKLWSTVEERYVPIGEVALLVSMTSTEYTWLNSKGLFTAHASDQGYDKKMKCRGGIKPRKSPVVAT